VPRPRDRFSILFVCTGNICRSPTAERMLRHALVDRLGDAASHFEVGSAGTGALVDYPIQEHAAELLTRQGIDVSGFAARQLDAELVADADLVLGLTREHRAAAATAAPSIIRRLFTLREFARLAEAGAAEVRPEQPPVERARALAQAATAQRGIVRPEKPGDDDVPDPYGGPADAYRLAFTLIEASVRVVAELIATG